MAWRSTCDATGTSRVSAIIADSVGPSATERSSGASHVLRHAIDLVVATHASGETAPEAVRRYVRFGSSPRGAQSIVLAAKATALLDGRPNVSVQDVRAVAPAALRHRLVVGYEATADGVAADDLVAAVLDAVPAPTAGVRGAP